MCVALQLAGMAATGAETALPLEGRWSGKIQIPGQELILVVDLAHRASWNGSVTLPGLNVKGAPLTAINVQGDDVSFGIQALTAPSVEPPKIQARLSDKKLVGDFLQGGNTARFILEKTGPPQVEEAPRSTPVAKEFEGDWKGDYELLGYPRKVTLKLQNHASEPASADFVIVGRNVNNLPVDRITQQGNFITIESSASGGLAYEGRLEKGEIHGLLLQGPVEVGLVLRRPN
jgi:hypothetical protein